MNKYIAILLLAFSGSTFAQTIPDYNRDDWNHWIDHDGDCLETRHELLLRESLTAFTFKQTNNCLVEGGLWFGLFLGKFFIEASDLDVDHLIPLKRAHKADGWRNGNPYRRRSCGICSKYNFFASGGGT